MGRVILLCLFVCVASSFQLLLVNRFRAGEFEQMPAEFVSFFSCFLLQTYRGIHSC